MIVKYDKLNRYEQPVIHLCNPGSKYNNGDLTNAICAMSQVTDLEIEFNFNSISEANFRVHLVEDGEDPVKTDAIANMYKKVQNRRLLFIEDIGYFVISSIKESIGDGGRYKDVTASSIEEEINNVGVPYIPSGTYKFYVEPGTEVSDRFTIQIDSKLFGERYVFPGTYDFTYYSSMGKWRTKRYIGGMDFYTVEYVTLEECGITPTIVSGGFLDGDKIEVVLSGPSPGYSTSYTTEETGLFNMIVNKLPYWEIAYVDSDIDIDAEVIDMYRSFEDVDPDSKCFEFMINEMQNAYECIFLFDCINRKISVKSKDNYIVPTNIHISNNDFISLQTITEDAEDVCTALAVRDSGDTVTIGAVNPTGGNVIYDFSYYLDWMSDHLRPAVIRWMVEYETAMDTYFENSLEFWRAKSVMMTALLEDDRLNALIDMYKRCKENIGAGSDVVELTTSYNAALSSYATGATKTLDYPGFSAVIVNSVFKNAVDGVSGIYTFLYHASTTSWTLRGHTVSLSDYGISVNEVGSGLKDLSKITVNFTAGTYAEPIDVGGKTIQQIKDELDSRINDCMAAIYQNDQEIVRPADIAAHTAEEGIKVFNSDLEFVAKPNGFWDDEQLAELQQFIYEGMYTDDYVTFTESMTVEEQFEQMKSIFDRARDVMRSASRPLQGFTIDSENFVFVKEFSEWTDQLQTGCVINVETDNYDRYSVHISDGKFLSAVGSVVGEYLLVYNAQQDKWMMTTPGGESGYIGLNTYGILLSVLDAGIFDRDKIRIYVEEIGEGEYNVSSTVEQVGYNNISRLFLSGMTINYEDASLSMTFGNRLRKCDTRSLYEDVMGSVSSSANSIDYIKEAIAPIYEDRDKGENYYNKTREAIQDMRNLAMDKAMSSENQEITIDGTGITAKRVDAEDESGFSPYQLKITNNEIVMTDNAWDSAKLAIGEMEYDGQTVYGVNAEVLIGDVIVGNELHIVDDSGNDMFEVTNDKISAVVAAADETGERVSEITQTVNGIDVKVSAIQENGVDKVATTARYTFDNNGLNISRENGSIENKITEDGMYVSQVIGSNKEDVLVANNDGVNAINLTARKYLHIGKYSIFKDFERGTDTKRTACFFSEEFIEE